MVREKIVVEVVVKRVLELDGTDSMDKTLIQTKLILESMENLIEKVLEIVEQGLRVPFRFL